MPYLASSPALWGWWRGVEYDPDVPHSGVLPPQAERARSVALTETLLRQGERVMAQIEALEAVKARLEADMLAAYGALNTIQEQQLAALPEGSSRRWWRRWSPRPGTGESWGSGR